VGNFCFVFSLINNGASTTVAQDHDNQHSISLYCVLRFLSLSPKMKSSFSLFANPKSFEAIVIGAGPAGLQASLTLGRSMAILMRKRVELPHSHLIQK
jgi:hypothetical protein